MSMPDIYVCSLPETVQKYAAENIREDKTKRDSSILRIQEWIHTQPHLHARSDIPNVLRFLRGCKYDEEKVRRKMTNFYTMRSKVPEWFDNRDPLLPELKEMFNLGVFLPLLQHDDEGRLVVLIRAAVHNPRVHKQSNVFKAGKMIMELVMEEDELVSIYGVVAIVDLSGVTLGHALQLPPSVIKKAVHAWQDCYPVRTRSMDFINAPLHVNMVLNIFRKFMSDKLKQRVHVHSRNLNTLHAIVSPSLLPEEYGGSAGKLEDLISHWKQRVMDHRAWFLKEDEHKADT